MSYEKGRTITDVLAKIIEEKFEKSSMNNKCTHSRHITELMNCPVFMNKKIHYTKNKDEIKIIESAPKIENFYTKEDETYFLTVQQYLNDLKNDKDIVLEAVLIVFHIDA